MKSLGASQLAWLEKITPEDIQQIMNTLKMEPIIETKQEEEIAELAISPRFYESPPKNKKGLIQANDKVRISIFVDNRFFSKLTKVKNSMINSYISYFIYANNVNKFNIFHSIINSSIRTTFKMKSLRQSILLSQWSLTIFYTESLSQQESPIL